MSKVTQLLLRHWKRPTCALAVGLAAGGIGAQPLKLHVPSPDWRNQVVYFVMTDRFEDGDPRNNDQGAGEYDPADGRKYSGGDLRGLQRRLPYIQGLGATALWITPPVANQWWDGRKHYGGYHGYWAQNFVQVDRHLGTLQDYQRLADGLHRAGMYLVQDIVLNHTGDFFHYGRDWRPGDPAQGFEKTSDSRPVDAPTQWPFSLDDARRAADRRAGVYHWTPDITDYTDPQQLMNYQMAGLDDLNTENPLVRRALRDSYAYWIRKVGVDAFRLDTAFYVPTSFLRDFLYSRDARHPGIAQVARATGRRDFLVFGEGFGIDRPGDDTQMRRIEGYMHEPDGQPVLPGMLNFPLYGSLGDALTRGAPASELGDRITRMVALHPRLHWMPSFLDNHDVDRFLAAGSPQALRQGLLMLMTLPGIPVIYYGTEQGFALQRASMFAGGYGSGGVDHFDMQAPLYRYVREVITLRRSHPLLSHGNPTVLRAEGTGPGALAYAVRDGRDAALVVFNTADHATLLDRLQTGLPPGTRLVAWFATDGENQDRAVDADGQLTLTLPPRSGFVWHVESGSPPPRAVAPAPPAIDRLTTDPAGESLTVNGTAAPDARTIRLVIDGNLDAAQAVTPDAAGRWQATLDTATLADNAAHRLVAWREDRGEASAPRAFSVEHHWMLRADAADPDGDDHGPLGRYVYPADAAWRSARPMDLHRVQVWSAGGALRIRLTMNQILSTWNPPNGFDHVAFTLFLQLPGRDDGPTVMPLQRAQLPQGLHWQLRLRAGGWSNALFTAEGASATREGTPAAASARIEVDKPAGSVTFTLPAAALGGIKDLAGAKLYVTTWDYDGGYRALAPEATGTTPGGGAPGDPLVMDDALVTLQ